MGIFSKGESASQAFIPIKEISDDVLVMKDGSLRAVLMTSSTNFALKSSEERASVLYQFQEFLNSLDFSLQMHVQSRRFDIEPYVAVLKERLSIQDNPLMKTQIEEYIEFVKSFTDTTNIMKKSFFLIIPYSPTGSAGGALSFLKKSESSKEEKAERLLEEHKGQLNQRVASVKQGVSRCGVRSARLSGDELVELYNGLFNPSDATTLVESL
jgi:type IV secretory pathway VirB4 component